MPLARAEGTAVLQAIQDICQQAGCALLVVTHWNKTGDGKGPDRIAAAGPAARAWSSVRSRSCTAPATPLGPSSVLLGVELIGGELADTRFRVRRRVRADDPRS